jgi:hypothetical protein
MWELSKTEMDPRVLKRAALFSYIMGAMTLGLDVVLFVWVFTVVLPYSSVPAQISLQTFITILWLVAILLPITMFISVLFGYYTRKVGDAYNVGSLKLAGLMAIILTIVAIPVAIGIVGFVAILQTLLSSPPSSIIALFVQLVLGIGLALAFLALFVLLALALAAILGLVFEISLFTGISGIYEATSIRDFNVARWLVLVGIFVLITLPIGIIFYARALSKLSKGGKAGKPVKPD